jgi:hypothetical protein
VREERRNIALRDDAAINLLCENKAYSFRTLRIFLMLLRLALLGRTSKFKAILSMVSFLKIFGFYGACPATLRAFLMVGMSSIKPYNSSVD